MNGLLDQLGNTFSQHPELKWMTVIVGLLLLAFALYKLLVVHTVAVNGHVTTRFNIPKIQVRKPELNIKIKRKPLSPRRRMVMGFLYRSQQLIFGSLVFVFGLTLCTFAYYWLAGILPAPGIVLIAVAAILGIGALPVGFLIAYYRDKSNPFEASAPQSGAGS